MYLDALGSIEVAEVDTFAFYFVLTSKLVFCMIWLRRNKFYQWEFEAEHKFIFAEFQSFNMLLTIFSNAFLWMKSIVL